MQITRNKFLLSALMIFVLPTSFVMAQSYKIKIDKPEVLEIISPDLGGSIARKTFKPKDWMEIELKFKIEAKDKDKLFADKLTVKWYVAAKHPDPKVKGYIMLEKEVNHVNIPIQEDVYISVYLSPNSIKRLTGSDKFSKSDIKDIGGQILIDGQEPVGDKGYFSMDAKVGWWTKGSLSRYDKIPLLNKNETPFKIFWYSRYAEIEEKR